jgi:hypothetical protein
MGRTLRLRLVFQAFLLVWLLGWTAQAGAEEAGKRWLVGREPGRTGQPERYRAYLVDPTPELAGLRAAEARAEVDTSLAQPQVSVVLDPAGARAFGAYTAAHLKVRLAIALEGEVLSAPVIQTAIMGGRLRISLGGLGKFEASLDEAKRVADLARQGRLQFLTVDDRTEVVVQGETLPPGIQADWDGLYDEEQRAHAKRFFTEGPDARQKLQRFLAGRAHASGPPPHDP